MARARRPNTHQCGKVVQIPRGGVVLGTPVPVPPFVAGGGPEIGGSATAQCDGSSAITVVLNSSPPDYIDGTYVIAPISFFQPSMILYYSANISLPTFGLGFIDFTIQIQTYNGTPNCDITLAGDTTDTYTGQPLQGFFATGTGTYTCPPTHGSGTVIYSYLLQIGNLVGPFTGTFTW